MCSGPSSPSLYVRWRTPPQLLQESIVPFVTPVNKNVLCETVDLKTPCAGVRLRVCECVLFVLRTNYYVALWYSDYHVSKDFTRVFEGINTTSVKHLLVQSVYVNPSTFLQNHGSYVVLRLS